MAKNTPHKLADAAREHGWAVQSESNYTCIATKPPKHYLAVMATWAGGRGSPRCRVMDLDGVTDHKCAGKHEWSVGLSFKKLIATIEAHPAGTKTPAVPVG